MTCEAIDFFFFELVGLLLLSSSVVGLQFFLFILWTSLLFVEFTKCLTMKSLCTFLTLELAQRFLCVWHAGVCFFLIKKWFTFCSSSLQYFVRRIDDSILLQLFLNVCKMSARMANLAERLIQINNSVFVVNLCTSHFRFLLGNLIPLIRAMYNYHCFLLV